MPPLTDTFRALRFYDELASGLLRSQYPRHRWERSCVASAASSAVAAAMHELQVAYVVLSAPRPRNDVIERRCVLQLQLLAQFAVFREPIPADRTQAVLFAHELVAPCGSRLGVPKSVPRHCGRNLFLQGATVLAFFITLRLVIGSAGAAAEVRLGTVTKERGAAGATPFGRVGAADTAPSGGSRRGMQHSHLLEGHTG